MGKACKAHPARMSLGGGGWSGATSLAAVCVALSVVAVSAHYESHGSQAANLGASDQLGETAEELNSAMNAEMEWNSDSLSMEKIGRMRERCREASDGATKKVKGMGDANAMEYITAQSKKCISAVDALEIKTQAADASKQLA